MNEITHKYTEAPWYENPNPENQWDKYIYDWENGDIDHAQWSPEEREHRHPVTFDVETNARTPQDVRIVTAYDSKTQIVFTGWKGDVDTDEAVEYVKEAFRDRNLPVSQVITVSPTRSWFENAILSLCDDSDRVLVGHNAAFDLWMMGQPDDGALEAGLGGSQSETATQYQGVTLFTKRAGAFGRIYGFRFTGSIKNGGDNLGTLEIPVADTQTAAKSMWLPSSLSGAADAVGLAPVSEADEHGTVTPEYIRYNADDVAATHKLYLALRDRLWDNFGAIKAPERIYSTASIFKDIMGRMGYDRTHYEKDDLDVIAPSYFGGRTEAVRCGEPLRGMTLMDILSQYPTVCALSDVWRFMQAKNVYMQEIDPSDLPAIDDLDDLRNPETWEECADYYVVLEADGSTLPVRTKMPGTTTTRVYNANVYHDGVTTTHHYYDYIGSLLTSEDPPEIRAAFKVMPIGEQTLQGTTIGGTRIGAYDNVMKRAIEERKSRSARIGGSDEQTKALKITANSAYGTTAERIVAEDDPRYNRHDVAGKFYNPHVASTITAGGRLMISMGEAAAEREGGRMWYCDTDSFLVEDEIAPDLQDYFSDLNPYDGVAGDLPVLEIEDVEVDGEEMDAVGLDAYVIGEKKYAMLKNGRLAKYTEHGLGHYEELRSDEEVRKFWRTLLMLEDINVEGDYFSPDEMETPVTYQMAATTRNMRESLSQLLGEDLNYGDWLKMTIDEAAGETRYVGIDLDSQIVKITPGRVETVEAVDPSNLKTRADVIQQWQMNARYDYHLPDVRITDKEVVTKEATSVELDILEQVGSALSQIDLSLLED